MVRYQEVKGFVEREHRNPSKHRIEEHDMLNWLKANRKLLNAGTIKPNRVEMFRELLSLIEKRELLSLIEKHKHVNQWV